MNGEIANIALVNQLYLHLLVIIYNFFFEILQDFFFLLFVDLLWLLMIFLHSDYIVDSQLQSILFDSSGYNFIPYIAL